MAVELWIGQEFDTPHERRALDRFMTDMETEFGAKSQLYLVLANYFIDGRQIDLTVLKQDAIVVVELKECDNNDPFEATENGPWQTSSGRKIETGGQNPFEQVSEYRRHWMSYLKANQKRFLPQAKVGSLNFTHVSGYVALSPSQPSGTKNNIPYTPWFRLVGLNRLSNAIGHATSKQLRFSDEELRKLIGPDCLNLRPSPGTVRHIVPKFGIAPPRPSLVIGREQALDDLKSRLGVTNGRAPSVQVLTAVRGWPGVGKTTLAAALAHDPDVATVFPDGVLWAALGEKPDLFAQLLTWGRALGVDNLTSARTLEEISAKLTALLRNGQMLLIVDDVWQAKHAVPFNIGGRDCATLITTRFPDVARNLAPTANDIYNLPVLTDEKSLELLKNLAPTIVEEYHQECLELVHDLEGLPLAIKVAGGLLNAEVSRGLGVTDLLTELRESTKLLEAQAPADRVDLANQITPTVAVLLQQSTDRLDSETRVCFAFLGAFAPKPATFDLEAMKAVWKVPDPKPIVRQLVDRGLLEPVGGRFQMHALLVMHARSLLE